MLRYVWFVVFIQLCITSEIEGEGSLSLVGTVLLEDLIY